jgi:hypothetical protein
VNPQVNLQAAGFTELLEAVLAFERFLARVSAGSKFDWKLVRNLWKFKGILGNLE